MAGELTAKQVQFCDAYLVSLNSADAARRAGYPPRYADRIGWQNLRKPEIAARIERGIAERHAQAKIRQDEVIRGLARGAFTNIKDYIRIDADGGVEVDLSAVTRDQMAGIVHYEVREFTRGRGKAKHTVRRTRIRLADKLKNLEMLGRLLGLFKDEPRPRRRCSEQRR